MTSTPAYALTTIMVIALAAAKERNVTGQLSCELLKFLINPANLSIRWIQTAKKAPRVQLTDFTVTLRGTSQTVALAKALGRRSGVCILACVIMRVVYWVFFIKACLFGSSLVVSFAELFILAVWLIPNITVFGLDPRGNVLWMVKKLTTFPLQQGIWHSVRKTERLTNFILYFYLFHFPVTLYTTL